LDRAAVGEEVDLAMQLPVRFVVFTGLALLFAPATRLADVLSLLS
jgi:hypothetical protein